MLIEADPSHCLLPPHCLMAVKWKGGLRRRFPVVSRRVELEGAKSPDNYFCIHLPDKGRYSLICQHTILFLQAVACLDAPSGLGSLCLLPVLCLHISLFFCSLCMFSWLLIDCIYSPTHPHTHMYITYRVLHTSTFRCSC